MEGSRQAERKADPYPRLGLGRAHPGLKSIPNWRRFPIMGSRIGGRLPSTLIPARITGLGDLRLQTSGRILDVSCRALRIGLSEPVPVGSSLRLEFEDSTIFCEVRSCDEQGSWYAVGLFVGEMLIGASELSRCLATEIDQAGAAGREAAK
jgi:hypothetical protein